MDKLNKNQLVLLAFLVSFVSSIATGIVTVTLMQQAPSSVSTGINRVVEKTIEKVVPIKGPSLTETRIVKEEDFIVSAIANNSKSMVRISLAADPASNTGGGDVGIGFALTQDGYIVTDAGTAAATDQVYYAETGDGQVFQLSRLADKKGFTIFRAMIKEKQTVKFSPVSLGDSNSVRVGQSVISLADSAATGIVSSLSFEGEGDNATTTPSQKIISLIHTSTNSKDTIGSGVLNMNGDFLGIVAVRSGIRSVIPSNYIKDALTEAQKKSQ